MASLREVADAAGVGLGTASRALNGTGYVSEEKKKMILKAAEELHYRQNMSVPEPAEHHAGLAAKGYGTAVFCRSFKIFGDRTA